MVNVEIYKDIEGFDGMVLLMTQMNLTEEEAITAAKNFASGGFFTTIVEAEQLTFAQGWAIITLSQTTGE